MTDRLAEIEELLSKARPAPWEDASTDNGPFDYQVHTVADDSWSLIGVMPSPHDARLIARLVTVAPDLLAVVKAARGYVAASNDPGPVEYAYHLNEAWQALRAALANLEGGA